MKNKEILWYSMTKRTDNNLNEHLSQNTNDGLKIMGEVIL